MKSEILEFYNKAAKDNEFLKNLQDFRNENSSAEAKSVIKNVVLPYSKKKGYNFSESELSEIADSNSLNLDDLEQVSGGRFAWLKALAVGITPFFSIVSGGSSTTSATPTVQPTTVQEQAQGQTNVVRETMFSNECIFLVEFTESEAIIQDVISIPKNGGVKVPSKLAYRNIISISEKAFEKHKDKLTEVTFDDDCKVTTIKKETFSGCSKLSKIDIPESVKTIEESAFAGCTSLNSITLPKNITAIKKGAFSGCSKLSKIDIPELVTTIEESAFAGCTSLNSITLPKNITAIKKGAFSGCSKLSKIDIPESVTTIEESAFSGCTSLNSITLPKNITAIKKGAFSGCSKLSKIDIPESVTTIEESAFSGCTSLNSITLSKNITTIGKNAFLGCKSLNAIAIPEAVKYIGSNTFQGCTSIKNITIPEGLVRLGDNAFSQCTSLEEIIIPRSLGWNIGAHTFDGCTSLKSATISSGVSAISEGMFSGCTSLNRIEIPENVEIINEHAFSKCAALNSVIIPEGVKTIGSYAFSECNSLKDVTIPKTVETINEHAFSNCTSLNTVKIPLSLKGKFESNFPENCTKIYYNDSEYTYEDNDSSITFNLNKEGNGYIIKRVTKVPSSGVFRIPSEIAGKPVTEIGDSAFVGLVTLKEITIPNSIIRIGNNAFRNCTSLEKISIPNSITNIGNGAFYNCTSIKNIIIPNSVRSIGTGTFTLCSSLETVDIRGNIGSILEDTFVGCKMLKSVKFPNNITEIKANAFANCTSIESFTIPDSVTIIGERAFYECSALHNIVIPFSVKNIGESAFLKCNKLTNVKLPAHLNELIAKGKIFEGTCNKQYINNIFESNGCKLVLLPNVANDGFTISEFRNIPNDGVVTIPSTAYGKPITSIDDNAFKSQQNNLVKVNFEKDCKIKYVGSKVFKGCNNLNEVNISSHYTTFSKGAFTGCSSLEKANVHKDLKEKMENVFPITCTVNYISDGFFSWLFGKTYTTQASETTRQVTKNSCEFNIAEAPDSITIISLTKIPENGIVKIPSEIDGKPIVKLAKNAFEDCNVKQVSFDKGCQISSISSAAFMQCRSLESIVLPDSIVSIDSGAFLNCTNLKSITIPDGVTSIGETAFCGCSSLTNINLPNSLSFIGKMAFANCKNSISITIPASVTSIGKDAFSDFSDSQTIFIADGSKLTNLADNVFENCKATVSIPESLKDKVDLNNVKINIRQEKCEFYTDTRNMIINSIKKVPANGIVTIPSKVLGEYVEKINKDIFKNNTDIKEIIFEDDCQIKNINKVSFEGCNASISIPESLLGKINTQANMKVRPGKCVFGTRELADGTVAITGIEKVPYGGIVTIPSHINGKSVSELDESSFEGNNDISQIIFEEGCRIKNIIAHAFRGCVNLESVVLPDSTTSIDECAFYDCSSLESIKLPASVTSIGNYAFRGCSRLTNINLPAGVTSIGNYAFALCSNLTNIKLPAGVTSIDEGAFYDCSSLESIKLPASVTSIGNFAFRGCSRLTNINLPDGVTSIGNCAFALCSRLTNINLPDGVTSIDEGAFSDCSSLESIKLPASVTSIGEWAFENCSSLTNINLPAGVTSIGNFAFRGCSRLTNINLPAGVTSIGNYAFAQCSNLTNIKLPAGVTSIDECAFFGCSKLQTIFIPDDSKLNNIHDNAFKDCNASISIPERLAGKIAGEEINIRQEKCDFELEDLFDGTVAITGIEKIPYNGVVTIPSQINDKTVVKINTGAFANNDEITKVEFENGCKVHTIGNFAFSNCIKLTSVDLSNSLVTSIGRRAFANCSSLKTVIGLENINSAFVAGNAFENCGLLTDKPKVEINVEEQDAPIEPQQPTPEPVLQQQTNEHVESTTQNECVFETETENDNTVTITDIKNVPSTGLVTIPSQIDGKAVVRINPGAFADNNAITKVEFENGCQVKTISNSAFANCTNLTSVDLSNSNVTSIGKLAFANCKSLKDVIGLNKLSCTSVAENAFKGCTNPIDMSLKLRREHNARQNLKRKLKRQKKISEKEVSIADCTFKIKELGNNQVSIIEIIKTSENGTLNIPSKIDDKTVASIDGSVFFDFYEPEFVGHPIQRIEFDNDCKIKTVGKNAFALCTNLESVRMPKYLKSQVLKNHVFPEGCSVTFYNEDNMPVETITIGSKANQPDEEPQKEVVQIIENPVETAQIIESPVETAQIIENPVETAQIIKGSAAEAPAQEQEVTVDGNTYMVKEENGEIIITKILKMSGEFSFPQKINDKIVNTDAANISSLLSDYIQNHQNNSLIT